MDPQNSGKIVKMTKIVAILTPATIFKYVALAVRASSLPWKKP